MRRGRMRSPGSSKLVLSLIRGVCGCLQSTSVLVVFVVITIKGLIDRPQEILEGPFCHGPPLPTRHGISESEVDALVDADVHHVPGRVREALICARLLY